MPGGLCHASRRLEMIFVSMPVSASAGDLVGAFLPCDLPAAVVHCGLSVCSVPFVCQGSWCRPRHRLKDAASKRSLGGVSGRACTRFGYAKAATVQFEGLIILRTAASCVRGCPLPDDTLKPRLSLGALNPEGPYPAAPIRGAAVAPLVLQPVGRFFSSSRSVDLT